MASAIVAAALGRSAALVELDAEYCSLARERIREMHDLAVRLPRSDVRRGE
jgi:hypothetical protein